MASASAPEQIRRLGSWSHDPIPQIDRMKPEVALHLGEHLGGGSGCEVARLPAAA